MDIKVKAMGDYQTNCYIVSMNNGDIIIDPGVGALSWIKENIKNPLAILNTHGHFDHVWSNQAVKDEFDIKIYVPKDDNFMLKSDFYGMGMPPSNADVLIEPDEEIEIENIKIKFHHFPGHTPGCSVIQIDKHLFTGDFIFKGTIGRFDFPNSNEKDMKESLHKILAWKDKDFFVYPGHGDKTKLIDEVIILKKWEENIRNIYG